MAKILLVEDDVNLREIYSARFAAESYQVITASDGEEALATAVRERPDLIVLDVMMPKISGFDVLDILRSTPETKETKVIMMTALSQESDRQRGESLGANKYLIKSQVTLEDVVNAVKEQLGGAPATPAASAPAPAPAAPAPAAPTAPAASAAPPTPPAAK
jgi:DNA-binding response OmpR family regulator